MSESEDRVPTELEAVAKWLGETVTAMVVDLPGTRWTIRFGKPFDGDEDVFRVLVTPPASKVVQGKQGLNIEAIRRVGRAIARAHGYTGRLDVQLRDLRE